MGDRQLEDVEGRRTIGIRTAWINRDQVPLDPTLMLPNCTIGNLLRVIDLLA